MKAFTIGQVARDAGVGVETVRFYERKGLLKEPTRKMSGYRVYHPPDVERLRFIRRAKDLGFTLKEIKDLLALRTDPETTCSEVRAMADAKLQDVDNKIRMLQQIKKALSKLKVSCRGRGPVADCPILEAMGTITLD